MLQLYLFLRIAHGTCLALLFPYVNKAYGFPGKQFLVWISIQVIELLIIDHVHATQIKF